MDCTAVCPTKSLFRRTHPNKTLEKYPQRNNHRPRVVASFPVRHHSDANRKQAHDRHHRIARLHNQAVETRKQNVKTVNFGVYSYLSTNQPHGHDHRQSNAQGRVARVLA